MLHKLEYTIVYFGIFTDTAQVITDDGQVVLPRVYLFDSAYPFYCTLFQAVAADGVHRIGGIDDKSAVIQDINDTL